MYCTADPLRRLKRFVKDLDKVGGEQSDHAFVAAQTAHPPGAIAGVQALDEIALDEAQILFRLWYGISMVQSLVDSGRVSGTSPPHEYTALTQQGKREGRLGASKDMAVAGVYVYSV